MRLFNVYTFEFAEFEGDSIPPYKITSHRWMNDEVSWKDVVKKRNTESKGYKKLLGFCQFVREDNERLKKHVTNDLSACEWIWIDTACIDKKSSAEVSESINSMFGWYSRALECIAYLADVPPLSQGTETVMSEFRQSEWFTRGWTLQELIVPRFVVFLTQEWEVIGHKCAYCDSGNPCKDAGPLLNNVLSQIIGIAEDIVCDYSESTKLGPDEKMAWMASRTTTKTEDMAYCMMGIFDVNMSLRYGEGVKAMARLEREISNQKDHELPVSSSALADLRTKMGSTEQHNKQRTDNVAIWSIRPATKIIDRPTYECQVTECASIGKSFARRLDLIRHTRMAHSERNVKMWDCEIPSCHRRGEYGFTRADKMRAHVHATHRGLGGSSGRPQPRDSGKGRD